MEYDKVKLWVISKNTKEGKILLVLKAKIQIKRLLLNIGKRSIK
jgi:hypothetical protein